MDYESAEFIKKIRQKDPQALELVIRKYTRHLYKACLGLGFKDFEAEDIVQSVWMTFFDVIEKFEARSRIRTFLFGILYNKASEHRRSSQRADPTDSIEDIIDSHFDQNGHWLISHSPQSPDRFLESSQTMTIISKCIDYLPLNQKMAFILKEVEDEVTEQICEILNVTSSNLGVLLFRARNQLRECIESKVS